MTDKKPTAELIASPLGVSIQDLEDAGYKLTRFYEGGPGDGELRAKIDDTDWMSILEAKLHYLEAKADNEAVDALCSAMKDKLAKKRAQGYGGWQTATQEHLNNLLQAHLSKGDPVDIANFCMMLYGNGQRVTADRLAELEAALEHIANGCLVPPDGGSPCLQDAIDTAKQALQLKEAE